MEEIKSQLYKPVGCKYLSESEDNQVRLIIQGPPFAGKTTSALTFPNPVILTYDRKVSAHLHRGDVPLVPFYDPSYVDSVVRRAGTSQPPNRKDALIKFLETEGMKLSHEQTLIMDGCTGIEDGYHQWFKVNEDDLATSKKGEYNKFVQWDLKLKYFKEIWNLFKALRCDVIFICHEQDDRNKDGTYNGKIRPLLTGQVADTLGKNFTDALAQVVISKPQGIEERNRMREKFQVDDATIDMWCKASDPVYRAIHLWQTQADDMRDCGTSSLVNVPKYILSNYNTFVKYKKNKQIK